MQIPDIYSAITRSITEVVSLADHEIEMLISVLEVKKVRKKEFLLRAGEVCRFETFVNTGCLKVYYTDTAGIEHNVKFAPETWWSIDLESFTLQTPAFYSIQAIENSECIQISRSNHDWLYDQIPKLEKFQRLLFQNAYIMLQHRMTQNLFATAEERHDAFMQKYPGLELRIPQKDIASYLGITPEFLSMMRKKRTKAAIS